MKGCDTPLSKFDIQLSTDRRDGWVAIFINKDPRAAGYVQRRLREPESLDKAPSFASDVDNKELIEASG